MRSAKRHNAAYVLSILKKHNQVQFEVYKKIHFALDATKLNRLKLFKLYFP